MNRPDFGRVHRVSQQLAGMVGETGTWRKYASASASNNAAFGDGPGAYYAQETVSGLLKHITPEEVQRAGGTLQEGDVQATLFNCAPASDDELVWQGVTYKAMSVPIPQRLQGGSGYRVLLRRGQ